MVGSPTVAAHSCTLVYDCLTLCKCLLDAGGMWCKGGGTRMTEYCRRVCAHGPFAAHQGLPEHCAEVPDRSDIHGRALQLPSQPRGPQDCASHGCRVCSLLSQTIPALRGFMPSRVQDWIAWSALWYDLHGQCAWSAVIYQWSGWRPFWP